MDTAITISDKKETRTPKEPFDHRCSDLSPDGPNRLCRTIRSAVAHSGLNHSCDRQNESQVRDIQWLILTPEMSIVEAPEFDVLLVPGVFGQQQLMNDEEVLSLIRNHFRVGRLVFSVCTGALLCGAAGIMRGRQAITHWAAWNLLPYLRGCTGSIARRRGMATWSPLPALPPGSMPR